MDYNIAVSANVPLPIHVQVLEQIKWFIVLGLLKPGDILVPAAQLADLLQVNRNTIQTVFAQLREEGILDSRKGYGTWVANSDQTNGLIQDRAALGRFLKEAFEEASESGFDVERFVHRSAASIQLYIQNKPSGLLLIVSREEEYRFLQEEISRVTGTDVPLIFIDELKEGAGEAEFAGNSIVTTVSCVEEVRRRFPHLSVPMIIIEAVIDQASIFDLVSTIRSSRTGFANAGHKGAEWIGDQIIALDADYISLTVGDTVEMETMLKTVDQVYAVPSVYESVKAIAPAKVKLLKLQLEKSSEFQLKHFFETDFTR